MRTIQPTFTYEEAEILSTLVFNTRREFYQYCENRRFKSEDIDRYTQQLFNIYMKLCPPDEEVANTEKELGLEEGELDAKK